MAASTSHQLYRACSDGDVESVRRLLPHIPISILNSLESDGSSCLHAACRNGHPDIVRLLVKYGASSQITDRDNRTPSQVAKDDNTRKALERPQEDAVQHYAADQTEGPNWLFGKHDAEAYSRAIHWGCIKDRGVKKTVKKIEKAKILHDYDATQDGKSLRYYLNQAREKNQPIFFLKMYTVNGLFFKELNQYMATGDPRKVFNKLCHKWSGYYTGAVMKNPALDTYRYAGITYRGMIINREEFKQYKTDVVLTNKAFQSTSKRPSVALRFAAWKEPKIYELSVMVRYEILDRKSALDIRTVSEFPGEEEVLMVPGGLFRIDDVFEHVDPCQVFQDVNSTQVPAYLDLCLIHLRQLPWNRE